MKRFQQRETGYQKIQGSKPQTLAFALQVVCVCCVAVLYRCALALC
jgi:hypothetical protein